MHAHTPCVYTHTHTHTQTGPPAQLRSLFLFYSLLCPAQKPNAHTHTKTHTHTLKNTHKRAHTHAHTKEYLRSSSLCSPFATCCATYKRLKYMRCAALNASSTPAWTQMNTQQHILIQDYCATDTYTYIYRERERNTHTWERGILGPKHHPQ